MPFNLYPLSRAKPNNSHSIKITVLKTLGEALAEAIRAGIGRVLTFVFDVSKVPKRGLAASARGKRLPFILERGIAGQQAERQRRSAHSDIMRVIAMNTKPQCGPRPRSALGENNVRPFMASCFLSVSHRCHAASGSGGTCPRESAAERREFRARHGHARNLVSSRPVVRTYEIHLVGNIDFLPRHEEETTPSIYRYSTNASDMQRVLIRSVGQD